MKAIGFAGLVVSVISAVPLLSGPAVGLDESRVREVIVGAIETGRPCDADPGQPFWQIETVEVPSDGYRLRYSRFGCAIGPVGAVVVAPGRSEPSYEYYETALDLTAMGYGPIYVLDHRGQGLSPRLLPDPDKGHVVAFEDYVSDLDTAIDAVQADLADLGEAAAPPLFFLSSSMGGAIGIGHLQAEGADSPFAAAVMLGAMIHVNYQSYTGRDPTWLALRIYSETGVLAQATWRCRVAGLWRDDACEAYATSESFGGYQPGSREFVPDSEAMMTHSAARYGLRTHFWDSVDWSGFAEEHYRDDEIWSGPQLGGATVGWVLEAARFSRAIRRTETIEGMVHVPVLLMTGSRDLRAYRPYATSTGRVPDLSRHTGFCDAVNAAALRLEGRYVCSFLAVNGGFHELLKERDAERDVVLHSIDWFFRANAGPGAVGAWH